MAENANGDDAQIEPAAVGAAHEGGHMEWNVQLTSLERLVPDPEDDDPDVAYGVSFSVDGPNADGELEVTVIDTADVEVVAVALDTLLSALKSWADVIERRKAEMRAFQAGA